MSTEDLPASTAKHWQDCTDVYDFLDQVRLRPGMWLSGGSLHDLQTMLIGYQVALGVHSIDDPCDFWHGGAFSQWLGTRLGGSSPLGWAADIQRNTPDDSTPVEEFFRLLDAYRSGVAQNPTPTATTTRLPGIEYMINTFVTLFWRKRLLTQAVARLEERGFRVIRLEAGQWNTERDMHRAVAIALDFPDYYGHNLDALNDCLGDVACYGGYDDAPEGAGLVLVFTDYDRFATSCPRAAQVVLDIVADQARQAAVLRRRLICLVQSNDPQIRFEPVGAMPVMWNSDEWLDSNRRT
ncbi:MULTISPECIES: barstar family protein [Streptomyces]|uniref:Barstar family protein n=1 Tax=Streptomyces silvae TaxID=2803812 RepID=A0ABU7ZUP3_9ACTN|nr:MULTISPECIES: barstar family protein [unclassified Streptomyces]MDX3326930.1 barstar family protein [Streptomyces sp. ME02-6979-3A]MDX3433543.1 barstar family protein [Streptomyces sp. ME01-18a]MDX3688533.1 barstar family protein [Streptomyces sp. AK04-4c]WSS66847.1 barstar family protein [Streptomyces sp. NBC_01175]